MVFIQTPIESVGWEAMDSMTFSVASSPTTLDSQTFKIDISYENTGPEHNTVLLANKGMNNSIARADKMMGIILFLSIEHKKKHMIYERLLDCQRYYNSHWW